MNQGISFRNSKITYYGPHTCDNCGVNIVRMGTEWGGTAFTAPEGPIYPNTEWHPHVCDPALVRQKAALSAEGFVTTLWPMAHVGKVGQLGYVVYGEAYRADAQKGVYLVISPNKNFHDTPEAAWAGALRRHQEGLPTWHIDLSKYVDARFTDDLQRLTECPAVAR
jgi:hypothetical protein